MARKRKKLEEPHTDETWLIPYADLLTLLLALFIVLFATSAVDAHKFEKMANSLSVAFSGGTGLLQFTNPIDLPDAGIEEKNKEEEKEKEKKKDEKQEEQKEAKEQENNLGLGELDYQELKKLQDSINAYIEQKNLALSLQTNLTQKGLIITILDNALFASGSAAVKPESQVLAKEIAQLLVTDPPRHITVGGHTDNVPIHTSNFRSNWDLSSMRALNFMKILLENPQLEPQRFSATGYGEYQPVADNATAEGRAQNRRVEILILPFDEN